MKQSLLMAFCLFAFFTIQAQQFNVEMEGFSSTKPTYMTMEDGREMEVKLQRVKYRRGLIEELVFRDEANEKISVPLDEIKEMHIPFHELAKVAALMETSGNLNQMMKRDIKNDIFDQDYAYFVKSDVKIGRKTRTLLMQVLNPSFSSEIMVFMDPMANQTGSVFWRNLAVTGGDSKSFYIKRKGDDRAYRVFKRNYRKLSQELFGDCPEVKEEFRRLRWIDFAKHIYYKQENCPN